MEMNDVFHERQQRKEQVLYKHVLIPTDGSELSDRAMEQAFDFAQQIGAKVTLMMVVEPFQVLTLNPDGLQEAYAQIDRQNLDAAKTTLDKNKALAEARGLACDVVDARSIDPAHVIVSVAEEAGCDLIAMASHGKGGFKAFMLGSVTMKVLAQSKIPVLVYR